MTGEPGAAAGPAAPAISVVIPTRNRAAYLRAALEAIREGEFQDFEVWVVDQSAPAKSQNSVVGSYHSTSSGRSSICAPKLYQSVRSSWGATPLKVPLT